MVLFCQTIPLSLDKHFMNDTSQPPAIFIMGPTAAGKTGLAIHLLKHFPCEIISVDSALVYHDMNIGTAKPDAETLRQAPHHLIDIRDPADAYSAAEFRTDTLALMSNIHKRGKIPLLVGGTGLYFRILQKGLSDLPSANPVLRAELAEEAEKLGWLAMHQRLAELDPSSAKRIHPNDPQRIQRALEVCLLSGMPMSVLQAQTQPDALPYSVLKLVIAPQDRAILHQRIEQRFMSMLETGFMDEVRALFQRSDLNLECPSIRAVGYRQAWQYCQGEWDMDVMTEKAIIATRQLAKRQYTWLRSETNTVWLDSELTNLVANAEQVVLKFLTDASIQLER
jgi:tRNA dimethylallyltransferase